MNHVQCTLSHTELSVCEVTCQYLQNWLSYAPHTKKWIHLFYVVRGEISVGSDEKCIFTPRAPIHCQKSVETIQPSGKT